MDHAVTSYIGMRDGWHTFVYPGAGLLVPPLWCSTLGVSLALAGAVAAGHMTRRSAASCIELVLAGDVVAIEIARVCPWFSAGEIAAACAGLRSAKP